MIVIVDYGLGNPRSVANMIQFIGGRSVVSSNPMDIAVAEKIVLPGVGSFDAGIKNLENLGLTKVINDCVVNNKPILGICLGMQLMAETSEEGVLKGLGWISGHVKRFSFPPGHELKIPHMGWNSIDTKASSPLLGDMAFQRFYFVHSFHLVCNNQADVVATSHYGYDFVSVVQKNNIFGVQFHPEKSHKFGIELMTRFLDLKC